MQSAFFPLFVCATVFGQVLQPERHPHEIRSHPTNLLEVGDAGNCPVGTKLQYGNPSASSLPSYAQRAVPPSYRFQSCANKGSSSCVWCAPDLASGVFDQNNFPNGVTIVPRCAADISTITASSNAYGSSGSASYSWTGFKVTWKSTSKTYQGYARYEMCDPSGLYGQFVVPVGPLPSQGPIDVIYPLCIPGSKQSSCAGTVSCASDGRNMFALDYPCNNFLPQTGCVTTHPPQLPNVMSQANCCDQQACCNNKAQTQNSNPRVVPGQTLPIQDPLTKPSTVHCSRGDTTSPCPICAPPSSVPFNTSDTWVINADGTGDCQLTAYAWSSGYYGAPHLQANWQGKGVAFTVTSTNPTVDFGWIKYEFCDNLGRGGFWVTYF